jgi:hypothetical protein
LTLAALITTREWAECLPLKVGTRDNGLKLIPMQDKIELLPLQPYYTIC